jgi:PIN domain nuclease of toxin-antitoxin system
LSRGVLLDTNILLALINERLDELSTPMRDALVAPDAALHASGASLWEIAIKSRLGKLALRPQLADLPTLLRSLGHTVVSIEAQHVLAEVVPSPPTRDPFDRLLLGQCLVEKLRLMTLDRALTPHPLAWQG